MTFDIALKIVPAIAMMTSFACAAAHILTGETDIKASIRKSLWFFILGFTIWQDLPSSEQWVQSPETLLRFVVITFIVFESLYDASRLIDTQRENAELKLTPQRPRSRFSKTARQLFKELAEDD